MPDLNIAETILAMERAALDRWGAGDPDGFLEISAPDVGYFDPMQETRLDGHGALRELYNGLRGQVKIERYEMIRPRMQVNGDVAVLTFNFESHSGGEVMRWNTTEVYRRDAGEWRIIHTHWSLTRREIAGSSAGA